MNTQAETEVRKWKGKRVLRTDKAEVFEIPCGFCSDFIFGVHHENRGKEGDFFQTQREAVKYAEEIL